MAPNPTPRPIREQIIEAITSKSCFARHRVNPDEPCSQCKFDAGVYVDAILAIPEIAAGLAALRIASGSSFYVGPANAGDPRKFVAMNRGAMAGGQTPAAAVLALDADLGLAEVDALTSQPYASQPQPPACPVCGVEAWRPDPHHPWMHWHVVGCQGATDADHDDDALGLGEPTDG